MGLVGSGAGGEWGWWGVGLVGSGAGVVVLNLEHCCGYALI